MVKSKDLVYQLKISLKRSKPPIWRRVLISATATLGDLHCLIQIVMEGWDDYHMHQFEVRGEYYGDPDAIDDIEFDENDFPLSKIVDKEGGKFFYTYDFGDDWEHEIVLEKILKAESGQQYPICTGGKRACPPEDSGGVWGYNEAKEREKEGFNPELFNIDAINQKLKKV